jgi:hypothetical protein
VRERRLESAIAPRIGITPRVSGVGGMVSFQQRLLQGLAEQGFQGCFDLREKSIETAWMS